MKCSACGSENKNSNIRCEFCGNELHKFENENEFNKFNGGNLRFGVNRGNSIKSLFNAITMWGIIIMLLVVGLPLYFYLSDKKETENYLETEGRFVELVEPYYDGETTVYKGLYEYEVDGETYSGITNFSSNSRSLFNETTKVKYNPDNPSESVIGSGREGFVIIVITVVMFIIIAPTWWFF